MDKSLDSIVTDLLHERSAWNSIEIDLSYQQTTFVRIGKGEPHTSTMKEKFVETSAGEKFYMRMFVDQDVEQIMFHGVANARVCASIEYKLPPSQNQQSRITLSRTFMDEQLTGYVMRPEPIRFYDVGLMPLHEAIRNASKIGEDGVIGRPCSVFLFRGVPGGGATQDLVYYLDAATSVPLKVEAFASETRFKASKPSWSWQAASLDECQGFHVVRKSKYTSFIIDETAASHPRVSNDYTIDKCMFNGKIDHAMFMPSYDKGVSINDLINKTAYYNTPDKKPLGDKTAVVVAPANPLVATEPRDFTGWISGASIVVGTALLGVWVYRQLKRKR